MSHLKSIEIQSKDNSNYKTWSQLHNSKGIKKHQLFILSGKKIIEDLLKQKQSPYLPLIKSEVRLKTHDPILPHLQQFILSGELFKELDVLGTHFNLFICELPKLIQFDPSTSPMGVEVISPLGDPSNLGALARSCLAFGVRTLILTQESCHPFHPKAIKSSAGALFQLQLLKAPFLSELIEKTPYPFYALDIRGTPLTEAHFPKNLRFILGEEGPGLENLTASPNLKLIRIPIETVESLNASIAGSLFLYHLKNQR